MAKFGIAPLRTAQDRQRSRKTGKEEKQRTALAL
jgi:hypothetical protein